MSLVISLFVVYLVFKLCFVMIVVSFFFLLYFVIGSLFITVYGGGEIIGVSCHNFRMKTIVCVLRTISKH